MNYTIRKATEKDIEAIHRLIVEFAHFIKTPEKVIVTIEQMRQQQELFNCIVAETAEAGIVGFATYFFSYYSWIGKSLYLDDLYVVERYRGNNIGTALMDRVFEIARENDCRKVRWQVSNWNEKAIAFYKKRGAEIDTVEINCDMYL